MFFRSSSKSLSGKKWDWHPKCLSRNIWDVLRWRSQILAWKTFKSQLNWRNTTGEKKCSRVVSFSRLLFSFHRQPKTVLPKDMNRKTGKCFWNRFYIDLLSATATWQLVRWVLDGKMECWGCCGRMVKAKKQFFQAWKKGNKSLFIFISRC